MHFSKQNDPDQEKLPGEFSFRQENVWLQLEKKLEKPNRKKAYLLLAAASLLAIAFTGIWQIMQLKKDAPSISVSQPAPAKEPIMEPYQNNEPVNEQIHTVQPLKQRIEKKAVKEKYTAPKPPATIITEVPPVANKQEEAAIAETTRQPIPRRFRIAHINEAHAVPPSVALKTNLPNSIARIEITVPEVDDIQSPSKPKGMLGLLRSNQ